MSQRRVKQVRRQVKKAATRIIDEHIDALLALPFKERVEAAWWIFRGKR